MHFQNKSIDSAKVDVKLKDLQHYFMTDAISRASPTMAKCITAVNKQIQENSKQRASN